jgi:hypothetical protein
MTMTWVQVPSDITGVPFVFTLHMHCMSIVRPVQFRNLSVYFLVIFLSHETAAFIHTHVAIPLLRIMIPVNYDIII